MPVLEPHDLPCDEDKLPQHFATQATWKSQQWQIGVGATTGQQSRAVICQKEDSALLYLTRTAKLQGVLSSLCEVSSTHSTDAFGLRMSLAHSLGEDKWGRAFFLNAQFGLRRPEESAYYFFLFSPHGWGVYRDLTTILTPQTLYKKQAEFIWSHNDELEWLQAASPSQLLERLTIQLNDPNSDLNFSRKFVTLSIEERRSLIWPCQHGDIMELQYVLRNALLAQENLWDSKLGCTWAINLEKNSHEQSCIYSYGDEEISSPALNVALHQVLTIFQPQRDALATQQHLCLQLSGYSSLYIEVDDPSFHDRLEATLQWRDWLKTNTPDEIGDK